MLQIRIFEYKLQHGDDNSGLEDINGFAIFLSLVFAILHLISELFVIELEKDAIRTSASHYIITCLNGRFGWVPFVEKFHDEDDV